MTKPENPPAFPSSITDETLVAHPGMKLRDWFAGQVLPAVAREAPKDVTSSMSNGDVAAVVARICYTIADAMLAESAKPCTVLAPSETVTDEWIDQWWPDMAHPAGRAQIRLQLDTLMAEVWRG